MEQNSEQDSGDPLASRMEGQRRGAGGDRQGTLRALFAPAPFRRLTSLIQWRCSLQGSRLSPLRTPTGCIENRLNIA